jgi:hypothetical protein
LTAAAAKDDRVRNGLTSSSNVLRSSADGSMWYRFTVKQSGLSAELFNRRTAAESKEFLGALVAYAKRHRSTRVLIHVHVSRTVFRIGEHGLIEHLQQLSANPSCRLALLGDTTEICLSHEYIELLARQRGIDLCCFNDESSALQWLAASPEVRPKAPPKANTSTRELESGP